MRVAWLPRVPRLWAKFRPRHERDRDRLEDLFDGETRRERRAKRKAQQSDGFVDQSGCLPELAFEGLDELPVLAALLLALVGLVVAGLLVWFVIIPVLLLLIDALVIAVLAVVVVVLRVVFRRPWRVELVRDGKVVGHEDVVGWRAAKLRKEQLTNELAAGLRPTIVHDLEA